MICLLAITKGRVGGFFSSAKETFHSERKSWKIGGLNGVT